MCPPDNVNLARRATEAVSAGDLVGYFSLFDPDVIYHARTDEPDAGIYHGLEEYARFFTTSWIAIFQDFRAELDEVIDAGDQTISVTHVRGRGRASGAAVAEQYVFLRTWRNGKTVEVREYRTKEEALEAVERSPRRVASMGKRNNRRNGLRAETEAPINR